MEAYLVSSFDMNLDDQVPIGVAHVLEADIPQNAGIVKQDVDSPKFLDGSLNNIFPMLDAVIVCDSFAAG